MVKERTVEAELRVGDCLPILSRMADESVDLVYLDPPFYTKRVHRLGPRDRSREFAFDDRWAASAEYESFLDKRLREMHRILSDRGSLFFHCDRNAVHRIRTLLDDIFEPDCFRAEIIWHYRRWSRSRRGLLPAHQTILYYSKSAQFTFNEIYTEYSPSTNIEQILQRRTRDAANKSVYERDGAGRPIAAGAKRGVPLGDVWDIPFLNPKARERTGYPTQKPLLLLERIIHLATVEGDRVLDPFCGSGTTLVAARSLNRRSFGIDRSRTAVALARRRLANPTRSRSHLHELGRDAYWNADGFATAMLQGLECVPVQRNRGIDAILKRTIGGGPVPIRVQRPGESLAAAAAKLVAASAGKGAKLMFVVATARRADPSEPAELPAGVEVIDSPAAAIRGRLDDLFTESVCRTGS